MGERKGRALGGGGGRSAGSSGGVVKGHQLVLKKFDISSIANDKVVILIGKRNTGKSVLVRDLLYYQRDIPIGTVIHPTESADPFYSQVVPGMFIHEEYTPQLLHNVVRRQRLVATKMNSEKAAYGRSAIDPRAFLILDDCLYDKSWAKDPNIRFLFMNGRHYQTLFVITMQHPLGIPPNLRTNVDYVFILRENIMGNRKRIYENYAGMFPSFDAFRQVMDQCTENYECIVIDNNAKSNRLDEQVFWYKAELHDDYRICAREFWDIDRGLQIEGSGFGDIIDLDGEDDDGEGGDMNDLRQLMGAKRNAPNISVVKKT